MDPPLINETSFSAANPSSYTLTEIWPFPPPPPSSTRLGLRMDNLADPDGSLEESTLTDQSSGNGTRIRKTRDFSSEKDDSSKMVSTTTSANDLVCFYFSFFSFLSFGFSKGWIFFFSFF
jgi:hypothetical protein